MSDIFIKNAGQGSPGWRKATNLFVKTAALGSAGWRSAIGVWIRSATQWLRVWPLSGVFATRLPWIGDNPDTIFANRILSSGVIRVGSNYSGNNAQWDANGWTITSYSYAWVYYEGQSTSIYADPVDTVDSGTGSGWTSGGTGQDLLPTTIWTSTNSTNMDRKYLAFRVVANASNSTYNGVSESVRPMVIRRPPTNPSPTLSDLNPEVGSSITYSSTWDTSEAHKAESFRTTIQWYRNLTSSTTGGTSITGATSSSYTPVSADVGNYLYVVETRFNSGTDYDFGTSIGVEAKVITDTATLDINFQATGNQRRTTLTSNFTSGTTVYVSTNGYISIGTDPSGSVFPINTGLHLMPLQGDQRQTALWTFADSNNFYVRWQGARYNDASQTIDYQAKFYWNSTNVDVNFVTNNLSSSNPASTTAVYNNGVEFRNWSASTAQSSTLISTASMTRNTTKDAIDDDRTAITASIPVIPSASGFARSDSTTTPSLPSSISFSSSSNQVTSSWTNGTPLTSVRFQGSGAGVSTDYTDFSAPFMTSDVSNYTSSATYSVTVTNTNSSLQVTASWNQTNVQSYTVDYSSSVYGSDFASGNTSGSSGSVTIAWSGAGSFTFTGITVYSGLNQTGSSASYSTGLSSITPTSKSSSRSGSTSLTHTAKLATPVQVNASDTRTTDVFITWNSVADAAYYGIWYGPVPSYNSTPDFGGPDSPNLITSTSYFDTSIGSGVTRDYYVQAFRTNNPTDTKSDWGGPDSGTRVTAQAAPTNLSINLSYTGNPAWTGSWSATGATSYSWSFYTADNSSGTNSTFRKSGSGTSMSYTGGSQLWGKVYVTATNSGDSVSGESAWT